MTKYNDDPLNLENEQDHSACCSECAENSQAKKSDEENFMDLSLDDLEFNLAESLTTDGLDFAHGGGMIEDVEGFELRTPMIDGLGNPKETATSKTLVKLPNATSLHFASARQESVCDRDDRAHVGADGSAPWRMICCLLITMGNGSKSFGTGWFISPRAVMTAGHCVFSAHNGGWAKSIEVIPGMNGTQRPYGSATSETFYSVGNWIRHGQVEDDYACIILPEEQRLGDLTGWFGFAALTDNELDRLLVNNAGYPGDKDMGTQWFNGGRIHKVRSKRLEYMIDTAPGQSGSPVWKYSETTRKRHVVGIHNYGGCANKSSRITADVYSTMDQWRRLGS